MSILYKLLCLKRLSKRDTFYFEISYKAAKAWKSFLFHQGAKTQIPDTSRVQCWPAKKTKRALWGLRRGQRHGAASAAKLLDRRAGHFRYFRIFSITKNDFLHFFIKLITYFCTSPCKKIIFYYWKNSKIPKVPSSRLCVYLKPQVQIYQLKKIKLWQLFCLVCFVFWFSLTKYTTKQILKRIVD